MSLNTAQPYLAAYIFVKKEGKIALLLRKNTGWMDNCWGLPAGKTEIGESVSSCAIREAKEEVGIKISKTDLSYALTMHRFEESSIATEWIDIFFETSKWQGDVTNIESAVHAELAWFNPQKLPENVIPNVRVGINTWLNKQKFVEYGW